MRRTVAVRLFLVTVTASSLLALPTASPASAAAPPTTCLNPKSVTNIKKGTSTVTLTNCTNKAATGGSGVAIVNFKTSGTNSTVTGKITWKGTGTTTFNLKTAVSKTLGKCPKGTVRFITTGKVTGGTGKAGTLIPKGSPYSENVCANTTTGKTTMEPGTKVII
jgi:hypothetical protein